MKMSSSMIVKKDMMKYVKPPEVFYGTTVRLTATFENHDGYPEKYAVKPPSINGHFNGPYTVHFFER